MTELEHGIVGTLDRFTMWHFGQVVATVQHLHEGDWIGGDAGRFPVALLVAAARRPTVFFARQRSRHERERISPRGAAAVASRDHPNISGGVEGAPRCEPR